MGLYKVKGFYRQKEGRTRRYYKRKKKKKKMISGQDHFLMGKGNSRVFITDNLTGINQEISD